MNSEYKKIATLKINNHIDAQNIVDMLRANGYSLVYRKSNDGDCIKIDVVVEFEK